MSYNNMNDKISNARIYLKMAANELETSDIIDRDVILAEGKVKESEDLLKQWSHKNNEKTTI